MNIYLILLLAGAIMIIEGLPYFIMPSRVKSIYEKIKEMNDFSLRIFGIVMIIIGFIIVFLVRSKVCM